MQDWIIQVASELMERTGWNLGILFQNSEIVALKYHSGQLVLNSLYGIWTPKRLEMVKHPYKFEEIPIK